MLDGVWCMVYGVWCMVHGVWYMVHGFWCMVDGAWCRNLADTDDANRAARHVAPRRGIQQHLSAHRL